LFRILSGYGDSTKKAYFSYNWGNNPCYLFYNSNGINIHFREDFLRLIFFMRFIIESLKIVLCFFNVNCEIIREPLDIIEGL
jgi:hypothetical protein